MMMMVIIIIRDILYKYTLLTCGRDILYKYTLLTCVVLCLHDFRRYTYNFILIIYNNKIINIIFVLHYV